MVKMNYYGINKKVPTVDTSWVGPKARLAAKKAALARQEWLDEVIEHKVRANGRDPRIIESVVDSLGRKYHNRNGWTMKIDWDNPYMTTITIAAPRGELIEEGLIDG